MTMVPGPIIEDLNVIKDIGPGQITGILDTFSDPFFFQRTDERFSHSIILAVATPTHSRCQIIGSTELLPVVAAVLATLDALLRVKSLFGYC